MKPDIKEELWLATTRDRLTQEQRNALYENRKAGYQFVRQAWRSYIATQFANEIARVKSDFWSNVARKAIKKEKSNAKAR